MTEVDALVGLFRNRAHHPRGVFCLQSFGQLSDREASIVSSLMSTAHIELRHASEADAVTVMLAQRYGIAAA